MLGNQYLIILPELGAHCVLSECLDFKFESNILERIVKSMCHTLLLSPICAPELASGGLEYAWGELKTEIHT